MNRRPPDDQGRRQESRSISSSDSRSLNDQIVTERMIQTNKNVNSRSTRFTASIFIHNTLRNECDHQIIAQPASGILIALIIIPSSWPQQSISTTNKYSQTPNTLPLAVRLRELNVRERDFPIGDLGLVHLLIIRLRRTPTHLGARLLGEALGQQNGAGQHRCHCVALIRQYYYGRW